MDREGRISEEDLLFSDSLLVAMYRQDSGLQAWYLAHVAKVLSPQVKGRTLTAQQENFVETYTAMLKRAVGFIGKPATRMTGKYWFSDDSLHISPIPGRVTLVEQVTKGNGLMSGGMKKYLRLYHEFHDAGLDIVFVLKTQGYSWSSPPQNAANEAKIDAWYFREHLKLPFPVVVDETPFTVRSDGRRVAGQIAFEKEYGPYKQLLIGRDGRIIITGWQVGSSESVLRAFIQRALSTEAPH
jgi:hypothetical protein